MHGGAARQIAALGDPRTRRLTSDGYKAMRARLTAYLKANQVRRHGEGNPRGDRARLWTAAGRAP